MADFGTIDDHKETMASLGQRPPAVETLVPPAAAFSPSSKKKEEMKVVSGDHVHSHAHGEVNPDCEVCQEQGAKAGVASSEHAHSHAHNKHAHEQGVDYDPDCAECNQEGHGHVRTKRVPLGTVKKKKVFSIVTVLSCHAGIQANDSNN